MRIRLSVGQAAVPGEGKVSQFPRSTRLYRLVSMPLAYYLKLIPLSRLWAFKLEFCSKRDNFLSEDP